METRRLEVLQRTEERCVLRLFDAYDGFLDEHDLDATALQELLDESEQRYRTGRGSAVALGQCLYNWLNPGGSPWFDRMRQDHRDLCVYVTVARRLRHLPFELLQDRGGFLCADPKRPFTPVRRVHERVLDGIETRNRSLRILFMASSPVDVQPVLAFENEEALILEATRKAGLDLVVEESGSLEGLVDWIDAHEAGHFDVVHLTGHAEVDGDRPVFVLENQIGQAERASAEKIAAVFQRTNRFPRLLFLSGCRTGAAPDQGKLPSLCKNPPERQAKVMSIWGMGVMVGPILGPVIGGWLTENFNWRWVFYVNLPIGVFCLVILWRLLPSRPINNRRFDLFGFALLSVGLAALQLMPDRCQREDWFASHEIWIEALVAGVAL